MLGPASVRLCCCACTSFRIGFYNAPTQIVNRMGCSRQPHVEFGTAWPRPRGSPDCARRSQRTPRTHSVVFRPRRRQFAGASITQGLPSSTLLPRLPQTMFFGRFGEMNVPSNVTWRSVMLRARGALADCHVCCQCRFLCLSVLGVE